ncbi:MAG TPA: M56 family metallopeptidase [Gemmataceae bacterium]|nr:M56 family metallopeptidase [Gemmataceae bacterium]
MPPLLHIVLGNAVMASLLALLAAAVKYFVRRPALAHGLWLLVLLKLLTPPIIPLQVSWPASEDLVPNTDFQASAEPQITVAPEQVTNDDVTTILICAANPEAFEPTPRSDVPAETAAVVPDNPWKTISEKTIALGPGLLTSLWLIGSCLWLGWTLVSVYRFQRILRHAQTAPENLQIEVRDWAEALGLKKCPTLWLVPGCVSPMVWTLGLGPRLLFPAKLMDRLDDEQRSALLVHELAHLRRRDHWVRWIEIAAMAVFWWHPVVWWARRELHEAEEQCCDAWVVWALALGGRGSCRAYALALLHTVDFFSHARPTLPAPASGVGQVPHLRRRLTMIMNGNTPRTLSSVGWIALLSLGLLLPLVPVQAQSPDPQDDHDRQIEALKKLIQSLEQQKRAEKEKHVADERMIQERRAQENELRAKRAMEAEHRVLELRGAAEKENLLREQARANEERARREADKHFYIQREQAEALDRAKKELAASDQERKSVVRFLQDSLLTQNRDPEKKEEQFRLRVDDKNPEVQKAMRAMEEITRAIEVKRQELRGLEEKLLHLQAELGRVGGGDPKGDKQEHRETILRNAPDGKEPIIIRNVQDGKGPIILKIDSSANYEQVKKQIDEIQAKSKQPIRVEIINTETAKRRQSAEPAPDPRGRERRDSRGSSLEEKLEKIMTEVEELRRELHRSKQPGQ